MMSTVIIINIDYSYYYCFSLNVRKRIDDDEEDGDRDDGHRAFDGKNGQHFCIVSSPGKRSMTT